MDAFKHITANPAFSRNITEVIYDGRLFPQHFLEPRIYYKAYNTCVRGQGKDRARAILADCEKAEREIKQDLKDIKNTGSKPSEREKAALKALRERTYHGRVHKSMKQYVQFYIEQERILDTGMDVDVLNAGMAQLRQVHTLTIIDAFAQAEKTSIVDHSHYEQASTESFDCSIEPMRWPATFIDEEITPPNQPWDLRSMVNILKAAAMHNPGIRGFEFGLARANAPMKIFEMLSDDPTSLLTIARGLKYLSLDLLPAWSDPIPTPEEVSCLKSMLQQAKGLSVLIARTFLTSGQWKDVFSGLHFPHLITLHLGRLAHLESDDLIGLLERHKDSLRDLKISRAQTRAEEGTWKDVALRLGRSLRLRYIGLDQLEDVFEEGPLAYSSNGYRGLAVLFMPSYSPHEHYLHLGSNGGEIVLK